MRQTLPTNLDQVDEDYGISNQGLDGKEGNLTNCENSQDSYYISIKRYCLLGDLGAASTVDVGLWRCDKAGMAYYPDIYEYGTPLLDW